MAGRRLVRVSIETADELEALKAAGRAVAAAIHAMRASVRPGVSTGELDAIGGRVFRSFGARSGPQLDFGFPGINCISVNDEAVHGIPGKRKLHEGDLVKLDVTAELDGFYADACVSVSVGRSSQLATSLVGSAQRALNRAMDVAQAGAPLNSIGAAVERSVTADGYAVCPELVGHGIGRALHEPPNVPNHYVAALSQPLTEGLVLTIEPVVSAGTGAVRMTRDGWTIKTADAALSAHIEHTIVVTNGRPLVLTV
jgi:methionyl aminopeptidase